MRVEFEPEIVVLGAGMGGLSCTMRARGLGARVLLVEPEALGGTWINVGCIPTKALVRAAEIAHLARRGAEFGVDAKPRVDRGQVMRRLEHVVAAGRGYYERVVADDAGIELVREPGRFVDGHLEAGGFRVTIGSVPIVIASGARPRVPDLPGAVESGALTSDGLLALDRLPRSVVIVGGGPVAAEFAQALCRLDVEVTLVIRRDTPLAGEEPEARELVLRILERDGVRVITGAEPVRLTRRRGRTRVQLSNGHAEAEAVLLATGREPTVGVLEPSAIGLKMDRGGVSVSPTLETSVPGVWALGDAIGGDHLRHQFTHVATFEGPLVAENALLGRGHEPSYRVIPRVTFTDPEVAAVGLTQAQAEAAGSDVLAHLKPIRQIGKARALGEEEGFVKLVMDRSSARLLGATVVAPHAGDMLAELAIPMHVGAGTLEPLLATIHPHPTLSEAVKVAGARGVRKALGLTVGTTFQEHPVVRRDVRRAGTARTRGWRRGSPPDERRSVSAHRG